MYVALECPASHKFAFNHGFHCCKRGVYPGSTTDTLLFTDGLDKCDAGNTMACSDLLNKCYEHVASENITLPEKDLTFYLRQSRRS